MHVGPVSSSALLFGLAPLALAAQRQASVGVGTGVVRYAGGSSFSALTVSPAAQSLSISRYLAVTGSVSLLEAGVWASQGRADIWSALTQLGNTRVAVSGTIGFSTRSDGVAAFRLRGRTWRQLGAPTQLSFTTEATRFLGAWYTDVVGGLSFDGSRIVGSIWLSGRLSKTYGSTGAASATLQYFLTPSLAVEASGGNYLRDPFQGLPRAGFITGGVRFFAKRRAMAPSVPAATQVLQPLVAQHRGGDTVVVRFNMTGVQSVAIAGNWNAWKPEALRGLGNDLWEAALRLPAGTYYFNLVVNGKEWVVPGGVATISDGMGGLVAVLNVL